MDFIKLTIDGQEIETRAGTTILDAARRVDIYIPGLCAHPDLPQAEGIQAAQMIYQGKHKIENAMPKEPGKACGLCVVEVAGEKELLRSCATEVQNGMVVITDNDRIRVERQKNLIPMLARHRHACLTCNQQQGCSRSQCAFNVPENERCCTLFGHCEFQKVVNYVGVSPITPKWVPTNLPILENQPLFTRDFNLCIGCTRCIRVCRDLRGIEALGFVYDEKGHVQVGTLGPTLEDSGCKFCTACVEVCPTGALMDKSVRPGKKEEDIVPCKSACPAHIDVPAYLRLIAQGKREEADAVIREKVPFPGVLGRACIHPCETVCRRGEVNAPVSICALKRYAADGETGIWKKNARSGSDTGKKVAIVGAGPAGLTAAFYIRKQGHAVTIFDGHAEPGGMMRYGIPSYRLPRDILDKEVNEILALGVELRTNQTVGRDVTLEQIRNDGFDAVFLAVGTQLSRRIPLEGSELIDVLWGVDFLRRIAEGTDIHLKNRVIVVGGGNVAVDVALSAMRWGAKDVILVCLEAREEMPACEWEIQGVLDEGIRLMTSWGPHKILSENGQVTGMELVHCVSVYDEHCVFKPYFDDATETIKGDQIILALGQTSDLTFLPDDGRITVNQGLIGVDEDTLETGMKGVYAGGDVTAVPGTIIQAIAAGRKAASSIDKALGGTGDIEEVLFERGPPDPYMGMDEGFASWPREEVPELELKSRHRRFQEGVLGYDDEQAVKEARRCLQCDLRLYVKSNPSPPEKIQDFNAENINRVSEDEGVFQLYNEAKKLITIKGTRTLRQSLLEALEVYENAVWFNFEEEKMYTQRESELIQQHLQAHGEMPAGGDSDLDDLF